MRNLFAFTLSLSLLASGQSAEPQHVKSRINSIGLFKNGLAYVKRSVRINKPGTYIVEDVPQPVYGTFWIESNAKVVARLKMLEVEEDISESSPLYTFLNNQNVVIHLKGDSQTSPLKGVLLSGKEEVRKAWSRDYTPNPYGYRNWGSANPTSSALPYQPFIRLKTEEGITFLDRSMIASISATSGNRKQKTKKAVLILDVRGKKQGSSGDLGTTNLLPTKTNGLSVDISYLTKGLAWAASYAIDFSKENQLSITQKAVIKNELTDLDNVKLQLISGFPNVKFSHVNSPFSLNTSWSQFFQQLNQRVGQGNGRNVVTQQAVISNRMAAPRQSSHDVPSSFADGVDVFYKDIGPQTLENGESLALVVDEKTAAYERIVLWDIPDNRQENGRYIAAYERQNNPGKYQNNVWDAVRFKNPFEFPMTTAAATFIKNGNFIGQSISYWVNPTEETIINANKALSISTKSIENELQGEREKLNIFGRRFQKCKVAGKLILKNYRKTPAKMLIKRRFSGELLSADDKPKCELREDGVYSVNPRNELIWELTLPPGKEKEIDYQYEVLVDY